MAATYHNIGVVYQKKGDLENALLQYQRALEIRTRVFGSEHSSVADTYNNMGSVYDSQGRYEEALDYYHRSLDIQVRPDTAKSHMGIGNVLHGMGKYEEALVEHHKALEVFLAVHGQEHASVADTITWPMFTTARVGTKRRLFSTKRRSRSERLRAPVRGHVVRHHGLCVS